MSREQDYPWNFSESRLYDSPYPGTAVGNTDRMTTRNHLFSESLDDSHYAKGPKGWKRSDEAIREDVCELLYRSPEVDASNIEISVEDGIVSLRGTVPTRRMKLLAEDWAMEASGVKDVKNYLGPSNSSKMGQSGRSSP